MINRAESRKLYSGGHPVATYDDYACQLEQIRNVSPDESEYWHARELQAVLGYSTWESFTAAITRAMDGCESARVPVENHFRETTKMVELGSGSVRQIDDWFLSRYACYLIAMNADSQKEAVAYAQTYFAIQVRRQEQQDSLTTTEKRAELRARVKDANKGLTGVAHDAGVRRFGIFHDAGYRGLYGELGLSEIKRRKGIDDKEDLLDCVNHTELAANYFRITQAQERIAKQPRPDERLATQTHHDVGVEVRNTIKKIGGKMPESLPAETSLKKMKRLNRTDKGQRLLDG